MFIKCNIYCVYNNIVISTSSSQIKCYLNFSHEALKREYCLP